MSRPSAAYSSMRAATVCGSPTSAVPAPPRTRPTPAHRLGLNLKRLARCARRRPRAARPCGAGLPNPSARTRPARGHGLVVEPADQVLGGGPGGILGLAHDHVQADAELDRAAMLRGAGAHIGHLLRHVRRRLAPGQVGIDLLARQLVRGLGRPAEVHRRMRALHRRVQHPGALHGQVLAAEVDLPAVMAGGQHVAPDADELAPTPRSAPHGRGTGHRPPAPPRRRR